MMERMYYLYFYHTDALRGIYNKADIKKKMYDWETIDFREIGCSYDNRKTVTIGGEKYRIKRIPNSWLKMTGGHKMRKDNIEFVKEDIIDGTCTNFTVCEKGKFGGFETKVYKTYPDIPQYVLWFIGDCQANSHRQIEFRNAGEYEGHTFATILYKKQMAS